MGGMAPPGRMGAGSACRAFRPRFPGRELPLPLAIYDELHCQDTEEGASKVGTPFAACIPQLVMIGFTGDAAMGHRGPLRTLSSPATPLPFSLDPALAQLALIQAAVGMPVDHGALFPNGRCGFNRMFHPAARAGTIPLRYRTSTQSAWMADQFLDIIGLPARLDHATVRRDHWEDGKAGESCG